MKKSLLALAAMIVMFASCEGPEGPAGESPYIYIADIVILDEEWELMNDGDGTYFMCTVNFSALTNSIYLDGNVFVYRYIRPGQNSEVQTPLPFTLHLMEGTNYIWTETTYFDFMPGSIAFYVQYSDFATNITPGTQEFRVVLNR